MTHKSDIYQDTVDDHITLKCSCGWSDDLGFGPTVEDVTAAWGRHLTEVDT